MRADRAPLAPTEHAGETFRRTPPPLPQIKARTTVAAPVASEPLDIILRGLLRRDEPAPAAGEAVMPGGVEAQRESGAAETNERRAIDDRQATDGDPIAADLKVSGPAAGPVAALAEPDTVEPEPAATGAAPEAAIDDGPIVVQADGAPPLKVSASESATAPDEAAEDIRDAEVLIVTRKPAARDATAAVPDALEAAIEAASSSDGVGEDAFGDKYGPPGGEAAVRIVARRRTQPEPEERPAARASRERPGYSPEFIARRLGVRDEDDRGGGESYAAYHDAVEEATVTIIRARASEEPVSSVMPERAANDQPLAEDAPAAPARKKGALGLRFLKALTGER